MWLTKGCYLNVISRRKKFLSTILVTGLQHMTEPPTSFQQLQYKLKNRWFFYSYFSIFFFFQMTTPAKKAVAILCLRLYYYYMLVLTPSTLTKVNQDVIAYTKLYIMHNSQSTTKVSLSGTFLTSTILQSSKFVFSQHFPYLLKKHPNNRVGRVSVKSDE